jgi:hypothetical protein
LAVDLSAAPLLERVLSLALLERRPRWRDRATISGRLHGSRNLHLERTVSGISLQSLPRSTATSSIASRGRLRALRRHVRRAESGTDPSGLTPFGCRDEALALRGDETVEDLGAWSVAEGISNVSVRVARASCRRGRPESVKLPRAKLVSLLEGAGFTLRSDQPALLPYQTFLTFTKRAATGR